MNKHLDTLKNRILKGPTEDREQVYRTCIEPLAFFLMRNNLLEPLSMRFHLDLLDNDGNRHYMTIWPRADGFSMLATIDLPTGHEEQLKKYEGNFNATFTRAFPFHPQCVAGCKSVSLGATLREPPAEENILRTLAGFVQLFDKLSDEVHQLLEE